MLASLKVTLYDLFGYLLPGIAALAGLWVLAWALFWPRVPLGEVDLSTDMQVLLIIAAYILGHVTQALGNSTAWLLSKRPEEAVLKQHLPAILVSLARKRAGQMLGTNLSHLESEWLVAVCDEALVACGASGEREIFQYREGFYRGLSVSFGWLALATGVRGFVPGSALEVGGAAYPVSTWAWLVLFGILVACMILLWRRFIRFRRYRIAHAITGYLVTRSVDVGRQQPDEGNVTLETPGQGG